MAGKVESEIRRTITAGLTLHTPCRHVPFVVDLIDGLGVVLLLGKGQSPTRLTWECLEGIVPFMREHGGEVVIGGKHATVGTPGTLDGYLKDCSKTNTAGYVASTLAEAGFLNSWTSGQDAFDWGVRGD